MDDWLLEHMMKVSTLSCILIVLYFLVYSIWRISQMPNIPWNWQWPVGGGRHAVEIFRNSTEMPFTISMLDSSKGDVGKCTFTVQFMKSRAPPQVTVMWGPSAAYLMKLVNSPWEELRRELMLGEVEEGQWNCLLNANATDSASSSSTTTTDDAAASALNYFILQRSQYEVEKESEALEDENENRSGETRTDTSSENDSYASAKLVLSPPVEFDWNLLKNQYRYPAAIFITNPEEVSADQDYSICGIIQIIHLKNEVIPTASSTLAQYIKMSNGQSHILQPLYVIDDHRADEDDEPKTTETDGATNPDLIPEPFSDILCSVCQVSPVSRVIIPCRHVCLCSQCFERVEFCPICRGPILYYFRTREEEATPAEPEPENLTWWQRVERFNERFSDAMGLIRQY